ncbi:hypothetical protein PghCCS26_37830 [Paenibacillus glycanilyticus]|uniref:Uncharacterized protein n=1 Tax=Paenibacillus glycanilyticus TaxID=126569 RepID=A0ABQ6NQ21_9BACL|nr:hypothetical protein PghCCS26_37830 [Paenibacillus glycanilyticus]
MNSVYKSIGTLNGLFRYKTYKQLVHGCLYVHSSANAFRRCFYDNYENEKEEQLNRGKRRIARGDDDRIGMRFGQSQFKRQ